PRLRAVQRPTPGPQHGPVRLGAEGPDLAALDVLRAAPRSAGRSPDRPSFGARGVVRPPPARPRIVVVPRQVRTVVVFLIVELFQFPEQRLQTQLGGGIPVRLTG